MSTAGPPISEPAPLELEPPAAELVPIDESPQDAIAELAPEAMQELPPLSAPEPLFASRMVPPAPRPLPDRRRAIFFDVENTSRAEHIGRVLAHLGIDWTGSTVELVGVGNWRVIGHETARLLARHGAHLVHSAPSTGVRDWSDLRIAVGAGVWLASARAGDAIDVISDDQAFDAVGDVAASLGVSFRRLSYRMLAGMAHEAPLEEPAQDARPARRRRRGGRRGSGRRDAAPVREPSALPAAVNGGEEQSEPHTAPPDEIVEVIRQLLGSSPERGVSIDAVSNALKARGFSRPPGSLRLITRLRRIKELEVSRNGMIRLGGAAPAPEEIGGGPAEGGYGVEVASGGAAEGGEATGGETPAGEGPPRSGSRRRRRRGGRRRRGRGGGAGSSVVAAP